MLYPVLSCLPFTAYNIIPLYGMAAWGWDPFQLLIFYWCETVILAFWTMVRIRLLPMSSLGKLTVNGRVTRGTYANMIGFFSLHSGAFIFAHLFFLLALFSGDWFKRLHGVSDFFRTFFVDSGAWIGLAIGFMSGGVTAMSGPYRPRLVNSLIRGFGFMPPPSPPEDGRDRVGIIVGSLYGRIVTLQLALIFGAMLASAWGSAAPLYIVVALKTAIDVLPRAIR